MTRPITIEREVHFQRRGNGAPKKMSQCELPVATATIPGRVPRVARLMALAIRFDQLIRDGEVADYAEIARLTHVTRARITQIMNLLMMAPDIQEAILFLPRVERAGNLIHLRHLQGIAITADWRKQRRMWGDLNNA